MTAAASPADPVGPSVRIKRRRWYIAAFLSLACVGLGQLYNAQGRKAFAFLAVFVTSVVLIFAPSYAFGVSLGVFIAMVAASAVMGVVYVVQIIDAGVRAWRQPAVALEPYNRVWVYLLAIAIASVAGEVKPDLGLKSWNIPSGSMLPTFQIGDRFVADTRHFKREAPRRGDLAIHYLSSDPNTDYIRRVIGIPGDRIQIVGGRLHINGVAVPREREPDDVEQRGAMTVRMPVYVELLPDGPSHLIREERGDEGLLDNTPVYEVPEDQYLMLGDNRDNAMDSRVSTVGFVPRANFRARPAFIFWSKDLSRFGLRPQ